MSPIFNLTGHPLQYTVRQDLSPRHLCLESQQTNEVESKAQCCDDGLEGHTDDLNKVWYGEYNSNGAPFPKFARLTIDMQFPPLHLNQGKVHI